MKPVLTPEQAAELDRRTQARGDGITAELLIERAGRAVARAAVDRIGGSYGRRAVVVCGTGNNGGDGLVAARYLARWGVRVAAYSLEPRDGAPEQSSINARRLERETGVRARGFSAVALARELKRADVSIDAIFGTGFHGSPEGDWAKAIDAVNAGPSPVIAVDIPSGVDGRTGAVAGDAVRADLTVTFGAAKVGGVLMPGAEYAGDVRVVDIGFPPELIDADTFLTEPADVAASLPIRAADTHKRSSGVLLIVAGSRGMTGTVRLIAGAAGRLGTGLVIVAVPRGILPVVQSSLAEAVFIPLEESDQGTVAGAALDTVLEALARADALALGPGLTTQEETQGFVRDLVRRCPVPMIVDADALNAFAGRAADLAGRAADAVLTPHAGEFVRLAGVTTQDLDADRLGRARALAVEANAVVLLKGSRTVIASPDGVARVNPTGSAVLATAGSGDVLTGMIGGLVARGVVPMEAAASAAYLHGLSGLLAGRRSGEGTVAGDLVDHLPDAVARIQAGA